MCSSGMLWGNNIFMHGEHAVCWYGAGQKASETGITFACTPRRPKCMNALSEQRTVHHFFLCIEHYCNHQQGTIMVGNRYWMPPPRQFQPMSISVHAILQATHDKFVQQPRQIVEPRMTSVRSKMRKRTARQPCNIGQTGVVPRRKPACCSAVSHTPVTTNSEGAGHRKFIRYMPWNGYALCDVRRDFCMLHLAPFPYEAAPSHCTRLRAVCLRGGGDRDPSRDAWVYA